MSDVNPFEVKTYFSFRVGCRLMSFKAGGFLGYLLSIRILWTGKVARKAARRSMVLGATFDLYDWRVSRLSVISTTWHIGPSGSAGLWLLANITLPASLP